MPKVWNLRDRFRIRIPKDAVYCGRGTPYGNPFIGGQHGSRDRVIQRFVEEVLPDLDVSALRGKHLLCWCKPLPCHCDSILAKANRPEELPDGLFEEAGGYYFYCRSCDQKTEWPAAPEDFEFDNIMNVCGRSQWCLP